MAAGRVEGDSILATSLQTATHSKLTVLLDTSVIVNYLQGRPELADLFSPETEPRVQFAVNPIVLQELILMGSPHAEGFDDLTDRFKILPVDETNSTEFVEQLRSFGDERAHANSFLILGTGKNCDYVLSYDANMQVLSKFADVKVLNPEDFLGRLGRSR
jgi:predicted nucleic acid-binding protein